MWRYAVMLCAMVCLSGCQSTHQELLAKGYPPAIADGFDAIVGERERGSLDLLLSLPITRLELLLGKYLGLLRH